MNCRSIAFMSLSLVIGSNANPETHSDNDQINYTFTGEWQGKGKDAEGNGFTFAARVTHSGDNRYRILILDKFDTLKDPIHIMDGLLRKNEFIYTADDGQYKGGGVLYQDRFEGYYKGPVDGTYTMWRMTMKPD